MGYGAYLASQVEQQVGMAQAGVISETEARQYADRILATASEADRQEATQILAAKVSRGRGGSR